MINQAGRGFQPTARDPRGTQELQELSPARCEIHDLSARGEPGDVPPEAVLDLILRPPEPLRERDFVDVDRGLDEMGDLELEAAEAAFKLKESVGVLPERNTDYGQRVCGDRVEPVPLPDTPVEQDRNRSCVCAVIRGLLPKKRPEQPKRSPLQLRPQAAREPLCRRDIGRGDVPERVKLRNRFVELVGLELIRIESGVGVVGAQNRRHVQLVDADLARKRSSQRDPLLDAISDTTSRRVGHPNAPTGRRV